MNFDNKLSSQLKNCLIGSEYWTDKTKDNGTYISGLKCPECSKNEAYTYSQHPFVILCNRANKCSARVKTLTLFPEILQNIEKKHPPTKADPNYPATYYLNSRCLNTSLQGLKYLYWQYVRDTGSGAVMFPVINAKGETVYNGRLFNPNGSGKTHNKGNTGGAFWKHPSITYAPDREIFVTEGIIDALSLIELGKQSVAILSSNHDPAGFNLSEFKKIVFAFDNDKAGRMALKKWKQHYETKNPPIEFSYIMPISGDWNDILLYQKENALRYFEENRTEFEFRAKLALAEKANEYADIYYGHTDRAPGLFDFDGCYYYSYLKQQKEDKVLMCNNVSNFTIEPLYFELNDLNEEEPINRYAIKIMPVKGRKTFCVVTAQELSTADNMTKIILQRGRALWKGGKDATLELIQKILDSKAPVVRQLDKIGYDMKTGCYVFRHFMVDPKGNTSKPDEKGFLRLSHNTFIKPSDYHCINPASGISPKEIYLLVDQAWVNKGAAAFSWMVASWFVNQIKDKIGFFPFLSLYDDPQTGKTNLSVFMNQCQCLDEEGLPMKKENTQKGEIRKLSQVSGLFKALLESTNLDCDKFLTLYNVNPLQVRAIKSNDNRTHDLPFQSALMFVQNREPFEKKQQKQRVISLSFKIDELNEKTAEAFHKLSSIPASEKAYFFISVMKHRQKIEGSWFDEFIKAKQELKHIINDARITENHALLLAFNRILCKILNVSHDLKPFIEEIGINKRKSCEHRSETLADYFFSLIKSLDTDTRGYCFSVDLREDSNRLYIHLPGVWKEIESQKTMIKAQIKDIQNDFKNHPAYIESDSNKSHRFKFSDEEEVHKAWVFDTSFL